MTSRYIGYKAGCNSRGLMPEDPPEPTPPHNNDPTFTKACEVAGVAVTRRQYSKWLRKIGAAYKFGRNGGSE